MINKKSIGILGVCVFFIISISLFSVSALSIEMNGSFQKQETGLAKIIGATSLSEGQLSFYRGNSEIALESGLAKIGEAYYIWFITPNNENNYSIELIDVQTLDGKQKIVKNFSVSNGTSEYYIKPGAVIASKDFSVNLFSNAETIETVSVDYPSTRELSISPGINQIDFPVNEAKTNVKSIKIGQYSVPTYFVIAGSSQNISLNETNTSKSNTTPEILFDVFPKRIERSESNASLVYSIEISNIGSSNISEIILEYNKKVLKLSQDSILVLPINESIKLNLSIIGVSNVSEVLFVRKENYSISVPIQIERNVVNGSIASNTSAQGLYDCILELQGQQCLPDQKCTKEITASRQGSCCLGSCAYPEKTGSGSWIGWIIALVVLGVIGYLIYRYKASLPIGNPIEKQVKEIEKKENEKRTLAPNSTKK